MENESVIGRGPFTQSEFSLSLEANHGGASRRKLCSCPRFLRSTGMSIPENQTCLMPSMSGRGFFTLWMMSETNSRHFVPTDAIPRMQRSH